MGTWVLWEVVVGRSHGSAWCAYSPTCVWPAAGAYGGALPTSPPRSIAVHQRLHLVAGAADGVGDPRVAPRAPGHGLEDRAALILVAGDARAQRPVGLVVGRGEVLQADREAHVRGVRRVVGPGLGAREIEAHRHQA